MDEDRFGSAYSIAAVSKITGISCHAIRIWERRYGFPIPERTPSGHRRYPREQVEILKGVAGHVGKGRSIAEMIAEYRGGAGHDPLAPDGVADDATGLSERLIDTLFDGDMDGADALFDELASRLDVLDLVTRIITPTLTEAGERFFRREARIFEERCVTGFLRRKLNILIEAARLANHSPTYRVVVGSVEGDRHEGGGLILSLLLEHAGWRVINLGSDLAVKEYDDAVARFRPDALALSFILSRSINKRFLELSKIRHLPVLVGGRSILNHQALARRYGLIPVVCPLEEVSARISTEVLAWKGRPGA